MVYEYESEERKSLIIKMSHISLSNYNNNNNNIHPTIPCHLGHSRTQSNGSNISIDPSLINYRTHSRTPSGNFNFLSLNNPNQVSSIHTGGGGGHSRSASGGGGGTLNIDLASGSILSFHKHLHSHSRTASNCSNISFVSRLSEPISEVGVPMGSNTNITINSTTGIFNLTQVTIPNSNATIAAVQYYSEQVRNEMRESENGNRIDDEMIEQNEDFDDDDDDGGDYDNNNNNYDEDKKNDDAVGQTENTTLSNLHLTCIHEIDAGNEADIDEDDCDTDKTTTINQQHKRGRINTKLNNNNDAGLNNCIQQVLNKVSDENEINLINNNNNNDETLNDDSDSSIRNIEEESCVEN
jgi:hypothetical protein